MLIGKMKRFVYIFLVLVVCACSSKNQEVKLNLNLEKGDEYNSILTIESTKENVKDDFSLIADYNIKCLEKQDSTYIVHFTMNNLDINVVGTENNIHFNSDYPTDSRGVKPGLIQALLALKENGLKCLMNSKGKILNVINKQDLIKGNLNLSLMLKSGDFLESKGVLPDTSFVLGEPLQYNMLVGDSDFSNIILTNWNESQYVLKSDAKHSKKMVFGNVVYEYNSETYINKASNFPEKIITDMAFSIAEDYYEFKLTNRSKKI